MTVQLTDKEIIYLYGTLKKHLIELESIKPKSLVRADIQLHQSIISNLELTMPRLKMLTL